MKTSKKEECDERSYSIRVKLPSLGVSVFSCTPEEEPAVKKMPAVKKEAAPKQEGEASKEKKKKTTGKRTDPKRKNREGKSRRAGGKYLFSFCPVCTYGK